MTRAQAILILTSCKPAVRGLLDFGETKGFSEAEITILKQLEEIRQSGYLKDKKVLEAAGYSILDTTLVLGALEHYKPL